MAKLDLSALQARLSGSAPSTSVPTPAPTVIIAREGCLEDHRVEILAFCAAGMQLLGQSSFARLLDRGANWQSGADVSAVTDRLDAALDKLPMIEGEPLRRQLGDVARRKGTPTRGGELREALDALPWVEEYIAQQRGEDRAAQRLEIPEPLPGESVQDFQDRATAWEQLQAPALLRRAGWSAWEAGRQYAQQVQEEAAHAKAVKAAEAAKRLRGLFPVIISAYEKNPWSLSYSYNLFEGHAEANLMHRNLPHRFHEEIHAEFLDALFSTDIPWHRGLVREGMLPPSGWESLPLWALARILHPEAGSTRPEVFREAVAAEVVRRTDLQPNSVVALTGHLFGRPRVIVIHPDGHVTDATRPVTPLESPDSPANLQRMHGIDMAQERDESLIDMQFKIWSTIPSADGWYGGSAGFEQFHHGSHFAAITTALAGRRGNLDVSRSTHIWGRHEREGWGRSLVTAYRGFTPVAADEALWTQLDALSFCTRHCITLPADAYCIAGSAVLTAAGKLRISATLTQQRQVLVVVTGRQSSHGRHGVSGDHISVAVGCSAPSATCYSSSSGGGQSGSAILAAVAEGKPLLLSSGIGYALRGGSLVQVPGLGSGLGSGHPLWNQTVPA